MFLFQAYIVLLILAAMLAGWVIYRRYDYEFPKGIVIVAMGIILVSILVLVSLIGVVFGAP